MLVLRNMSFIRNAAGANNPGCTTTRDLSKSAGGGLAVYGKGVTCRVDGSSVFQENRAQFGGAIKLQTVDEVTMNEVSFVNNTAVSGGAVHLEMGNATEKVLGSRLSFTSNLGCNGGALCIGAMEAGQQVSVLQSGVSLNGVLFRNNHISSNGSGGGGLYVEGVSIKCRDCTFEGNHCMSEGSNGGGALVLEGAVLSLADSVFERNEAGQGGAAYIEGHLFGESVAFLNNTALRKGGGVRVAVAPKASLADPNSHVVLHDCSVAGNKAESGGECSSNQHRPVA